MTLKDKDRAQSGHTPFFFLRVHQTLVKYEETVQLEVQGNPPVPEATVGSPDALQAWGAGSFTTGRMQSRITVTYQFTVMGDPSITIKSHCNYRQVQCGRGGRNRRRILNQGNAVIIWVLPLTLYPKIIGPTI